MTTKANRTVAGNKKTTTEENLPNSIVRDPDGHLVNEDGYPLPEVGIYDLLVTDVEVLEGYEQVIPGAGKKIVDQVRFRVELVGTEQPIGEYQGEPYTGMIFMALPTKGKLSFKDKQTRATKMSNAGKVLTLMGIDIPPALNAKRIQWEAFVGAHLRGNVSHSDTGFIRIPISRIVEDPKTGEVRNQGLLPVLDEGDIEENQRLFDESLGR